MGVGELGSAGDPARLLPGLLLLWFPAFDLFSGTPLGRVGGRLLVVLPELLLDVEHLPGQLDVVEHLLELGFHLHPRPRIVRVLQHGRIRALHLQRREAVWKACDEREQLVFAIDAGRAPVRVALPVEAHLGVVPQALGDSAIAGDVDARDVVGETDRGRRWSWSRCWRSRVVLGAGGR